MNLLHYYRTPGFSAEERQHLLHRSQRSVTRSIASIETEYCFNVELSGPLSDSEEQLLQWLLAETFEPAGFARYSQLPQGLIIEVGPRLSFNTAWCTNAVSIFHACGLRKVTRIERSRRYLIRGPKQWTSTEQSRFLELIHDRMTECVYPEPLQSFDPGVTPEPVVEVPVMEEGRAALEEINRKAGLAFDEWDLEYYTDLFRNKVGRNPTNVECFDIAQSNSEHSRHWFFKGQLIIDGQKIPQHLIELLQQPLAANPNNSTIAFRDNSSAIRGYPVETIVPSQPGHPGPFELKKVDYDVTFTAETHNFPSGVAPFPGAETGTGGRIRDVHATGSGSLVVAGTAAYCVGNLNIPGYRQPWEDREFEYPGNLASPLQIEIEASNGASDYGNKFGEPLIQGFTRSFGLRLPNGERREWIKPIMFSGGIGQMDASHTEKGEPEVSMWVVKIGGPAYRIGMGGGAASSMVQGENVAELDFNAVQRGDAEMEQKANRVIRACVELGELNPIVSIHDQGAGGNCNVLKEIVSPAGAQINVRDIPLGDQTLSVLEIWGAEYQEQDALLLRPEHEPLFRALCEREKVTAAFVGRITGDGKIVLFDSLDNSTPVNLELEHVLGKMPQKTFESQRIKPESEPLKLDPDLTVMEALERVLRQLSVGSKRFLTNKVDRSVTGLIARQQCAGPLQLTVSDVAVIAQSHFATTGAATAIGEQPVIGLLDPKAMARMTLAESLTNLVWAQVSALQDVKCSGNWMWAAKLPGEGAAIYDAAVALKDSLLEFGIGIDGGKDSLSMAALAPGEQGQETVKAPGTLVISSYVTCPDVTKTVTPDIKFPGDSEILLIDLGCGRNRLGGSVLAHAFGQIGETPPDLDDHDLFRRAFNAVQKLIRKQLISAGHDRSDGGLITALLEMAFAGNCGLEIDLPGPAGQDMLAQLFAEELGLVLEVTRSARDEVEKVLNQFDVPFTVVASTWEEPDIAVRIGGELVLKEDTRRLRDHWEETSYQLDRLQANPDCVDEEWAGLKNRQIPPYNVTFEPEPTAPAILAKEDKLPVAIIREEGSNGDREMTSAFYSAGFETWDVTMSDLLARRVTLDRFRGAVFVGGFSYADVLDSAKGWAGVIRFNPNLWDQFEAFYERPDTFSLGICNGCQLLALLGWVPWRGITDAESPRFIHNRSGRFESRFSTLTIKPSPSIMLRGMEGSSLGVWVAHGEGQAFFTESSILERVRSEGLAPVRYVNDLNQVTEEYPFNPNGSPVGIAGLCSPDGRHLAMMPHPERAFLKWQWGWMPEIWKDELKASPWLRMFQNARTWCEQS
ncbi:MAG: phosphoribosylformylglycinamidine synthase [Acidobacteriota bacterium]|nr:MAG: phosphoribosylformylglycinamidine synthase [Acidobacteriota bacterium]